MEDLFDQMFFLDRELKKSIISNQNPNVIWRQIVDIEEQMKTANANPLSAWLDYDFDLFKDVEIPLHILRNSSAFAKAGRIYEYDRNVVDAYYLNKFGIDVSKVEITTILNIPEHAEAFAMSCGSDEHYVVIGRNLRSAFLSYDLLIHEFGHTVEFIEGRKNKKIDEFLKLNVLSEAIAHYFQIIYMLENSTKYERLSMVSTFTQAFIFYRSMQIMRQVVPDASTLDHRVIVYDPAFRDIYAAYEGTDILINFFNRWAGQDFYSVYKEHHEKRLGVFLALNIIKHDMDINELLLSKYPQGDVSVERIIESTNLDSNVLFNFKDMPETLTQFVNGTL
jgi:hypothetical protein